MRFCDVLTEIKSRDRLGNVDIALAFGHKCNGGGGGYITDVLNGRKTPNIDRAASCVNALGYTLTVRSSDGREWNVDGAD